MATLGSVHWRFELASHFLPQLAIGAGLCGMACAWTRAWRWAVVGLLTLALALSQVAGPLRGEGEASLSEGERLTLFYANVLRANTDHKRLREQLREADADVVFLAEVDDGWLADLAPELAGYSLQLARPLDNNFGVVFGTRFEGTARLLTLGAPLEFEAPAICAEIEVGDETLQILGVHTTPPVSGFYTAHRDGQLADLAARVQAFEGPSVVVGDLNTTVFADGLQDLLGEGTLRSSHGRGLAGTWPAGFPSLLRARIDHVLVSPEIGVARSEVGDAFGSDHRSLSVELVVQRSVSDAPPPRTPAAVPGRQGGSPM